MWRERTKGEREGRKQSPDKTLPQPSVRHMGTGPMLHGEEGKNVTRKISLPFSRYGTVWTGLETEWTKWGKTSLTCHSSNGEWLSCPVPSRRSYLAKRLLKGFFISVTLSGASSVLFTASVVNPTLMDDFSVWVLPSTPRFPLTPLRNPKYPSEKGKSLSP